MEEMIYNFPVELGLQVFFFIFYIKLEILFVSDLSQLFY